MQDYRLDPKDFRIIHAVQINPRASWAEVGRVLGMDPVTVGRRWDRLQEAGIVWVTAHPAHHFHRSIAIVELNCPPGRTLEVAAALAADPEVATIDVTVGSRDIVLVLGCRDNARLSQYVLEKMSPLATVSAMRTHLLLGVPKDPTSWHLSALNAQEAAALTAPPSGRRPQDSPPREHEDAILKELALDGRASATELASRLGISVDRARAALTSLLESGRGVLRTEIAREYSGRPVHAWYFLKVPARAVEEVTAKLLLLNDLRVLGQTMGPYKIIMAVWLKTFDDVHRLETYIEQKIPDISIEDRSIVLRTPKHLGRTLTQDGRSTREVPSGLLWAE